jgi:hypothetical protein
MRCRSVLSRFAPSVRDPVRAGRVRDAGTMPDAPKVFISHSSEDKERFVDEFATQLRAAWIDAWVDAWEMTPGDSLVQGVFDHGIGTTEAFVVVVSRGSLAKPWVSEELAVAIEKSISERYKIIPVLLDGLQRADLPVALRHKIWVTHDGDMISTVDEVKAGIFSTRALRPPLGQAPAYLDRPETRTLLVSDPLDSRVLEAILDDWARFDGPGVVYLTSDIAATLEREEGVSTEEFDQSMHALVGRRALSAKQMLHAPGRWLVDAPPARSWLARARQNGLDVDGAQRRLAIDAVNSGQDYFSAGTIEDLDFWTTQAVFDDLASKGMASSVTTMDGTNSLHNLSLLLRRWIAGSE